MRVIGLTGGIGMGKSTAAAMLKRMRVKVFDADRAAHALIAPGGAGERQVSRAFPRARVAQAIDRGRLGRIVFDDPAALLRLEAILHPLVRRAEAEFLKRARRARARLVALDIPLLYETGAERLIDVVVVVTAPPFLQRRRVLARAGANQTAFEAALARQLPDREKRRRADLVVSTGLGRAYSFRRLKALVRRLREGRCAK